MSLVIQSKPRRNQTRLLAMQCRTNNIHRIFESPLPKALYQRIVLLLLFFGFSNHLCSQTTPISCGDLVQGSFPPGYSVRKYTFSATAGDMILVSFCSSRYGYCDFFDPDTNYLAGAGGLARPYGNFFQQNVVKTGVYSLWVHNSTDTPIPVTYSLCWASDKQCSATPISFGQDFTVTLPPAQIRTYSFFANAHDFVRFYNGTMSTVGPDGGDFIDLNDLPATGTYMAFAKVDGCVAIPFTTRLCRYPKIIETPQDQDVSVGANVTFNVIASSSSTIGYQWRFNFTNIPGAINPTLILTNVTTSQSGIYDVLVYENANCMRGGGSANLSVNGISLHRLEGTALTFSPSDGVDMPLEVTHQAAILRNQPELGKSASSNAGLVADGVTPLLFKFTLNSDFRYTLSLSVAGGGASKWQFV